LNLLLEKWASEASSDFVKSEVGACCHGRPQKLFSVVATPTFCLSFSGFNANGHSQKRIKSS